MCISVGDTHGFIVFDSFLTFREIDSATLRTDVKEVRMKNSQETISMGNDRKNYGGEYRQAR